MKQTGKTKLVRLAIATALCLLCVSCNYGSKTASPTDASFKNNIYTNRFFGMGMRIPDSWTVLPKPSVREVRKGAEVMLGGNKVAVAALMDGPPNVHHLLRVKHLDSGKSIGLFAEKINPLENQDGGDFLNLTAKVLTGAGKPLRQINAISRVRLAAREFHRLDLGGNFAGQVQYQGMFVRLEKDYALMLTAVAQSEEGLEQALADVGLPLTKLAAPQPLWVQEIRLQGISGTGERRLALINGRTFGPGESNTVKTVLRTAKIHCLAVEQASAKIRIDGVEGERELKFVKD